MSHFSGRKRRYILYANFVNNSSTSKLTHTDHKTNVLLHGVFDGKKCLEKKKKLISNLKKSKIIDKCHKQMYTYVCVCVYKLSLKLNPYPSWFARCEVFCIIISLNTSYRPLGFCMKDNCVGYRHRATQSSQQN